MVISSSVYNSPWHDLENSVHQPKSSSMKPVNNTTRRNFIGLNCHCIVTASETPLYKKREKKKKEVI